MTADESAATWRRWASAAPTAFERPAGTGTALALLAVTALALALRLYGLGGRVFHWDEARVGYWILRYAESGNWEYHAIIHGPFVYHVNKYLFALFGASDFVARLPVAVVSGLLPLSAWLLRERLDGVEAVALGLFFAANPIVLYYSRFMRNDVLVAAFVVFALGFYVRLADTGKARYLYAGTLSLALAFTTKENVLVYLLCWLGAGALLLDHRLLLLANADDRKGLLADYAGDGWAKLRDWWPDLLLALVAFLLVVVFFYAPRSATTDGPGLWAAFGNPGTAPDVIRAATVGAWKEFAGTWAGGHQDHAYIPFFIDYLKFLRLGAAPLAALAVVGFVHDRYRGDRPRDLVSFAFYWGFVSVLGYPIITDISAPWATVHAIVPLAIPAAIGLALLVRWGVEAAGDEDRVSAGLAALLVLLVAGQVATSAVATTYTHPQDRYLDDAEQNENLLVQFGQPADGIGPTFEMVGRAIEGNDGIDVLYYGPDFHVANESENDDWAAQKNWYNRLPIPWYTELHGAEVDSTDETGVVAETDAPVVVARDEDRREVARELEGYQAFEKELTIYGSETVFFVEEQYVNASG